MQEFITSFISWMTSLTDLLHSVSFKIFGYPTSLLYIFIALIITSMLISIFWKGVKG